MRERLFKGFHPDKDGKKEIVLNGEKIKGEWVKGYYVFLKKRSGCFGQTVTERDFDQHVITTQRGEQFEVIPETVCEYVKNDCNSNKIFENDIVKVKFWSDWGECYEVSNGTIKWENWNYIIYISHYCMRLNLADHPETEVVGNVFDNPSF